MSQTVVNKQEIEEIIIFIKKFIADVRENTETLEDYKSFQGLTDALGIKFLDTLKLSGFSNWEEFYDAKKKGGLVNVVKTNSVTGAIDGICNALIGILEKYQAKT